ncbi:MAG: transcription/translation regulatory transformer protein RfaH [Chromatiales bacterium 21-64-14]|nr:MAG: transcription/translation regulatory transformer protein RfaH [Chromatiales bacterium 21-64-14]HQU15388.1 transcription/translation regulatory transformer protein RfaH [Gammaproteobacteria bacterium]
MTSNRKSWYLVYGKPRQERVALENLRRQGFEAYFPLVRQRRRRRGQAVLTVEPMFPRYLFVCFDAERDHWGPIRSTLGVVSLVRFGAALARVPDSLVALLRSREDGEGVQDLPAPGFRPGAGVRIVVGPLAGYEGIFHGANGRDRVTVLLHVCGQHTPVQLDAAYLEPLR